MRASATAAALLLLLAGRASGAARLGRAPARAAALVRAGLRALAAPPPEDEPGRAGPLAFGGRRGGAEPPQLGLRLGSGKELDKSLSRLPAAAQYNVVLLGTLSRGAPAAESLALVDEMSRACIRVSADAAAALIDAQPSADVTAMARAFDALARNPAGSAYGYCVAALDRLPAPSASRRGQRERALAACAPPPADTRAAEGALLFAAALLGAALLADEVLATLLPHSGLFAPPPLLVGLGVGGLLGADRYSNKGQAAAALARAASRVGGANLQREAAADAAACVAGYALGLPWCTLEPRAARVSSAAVLSLAAAGGEGGGCAEGERCVDRALVWLLAAPAAEAAEFGAGPLRASEPAQARALLAALRRGVGNEGLLADGGWADGEDEARVGWAYAQAGRLLRQLAPAVQSVRGAMEEGGVSPGRAIVALEQSLR